MILGFLSYRTIVKFFTQENMLMGNKFWNLVSHNTHYLSWKKLKCFSKMKMQNLEKIQSWILKKRFITGQWNFSCRHMLRSSPLMQNFMIVGYIVWPIWLKNRFLPFFGCFLGIFKPKNLLRIWFLGWKFAWRWSWSLASCMQNLGPLALCIWL